jgi:hypothetical protein
VGTPQGLSGAAAIALVQAYANEPTYPLPATTLSFLNRGVEEVVRRVGGIRLWGAYPTVNNQTFVQLNDDVLDIVSANFSMGSANAANTGSASPLAQGALVYPMEPLEQAGFMDAAAGFPAVGFGPPQAYFIYQDQGLGPTSTLPIPPQAQLGAVAGNSDANPVYVVLTYVNASGETPGSPVASYTPLSTAYVTQVQSPPGVSNAGGYNVYASENPNGPYFLQNGSTPVALGTPFTLPSPLVLAAVLGTQTGFAIGTQGGAEIGLNPEVATPPTTNTATGSGTGGAMFMQLYPAAMVGQVNIYYRARPQLWADTTANSWTNFDTSGQEAAVIFAVMRVLAARGRAAEAKEIWRPEFESLIGDLKESLGRRTTPKSGRVRDVANRSFPSAPFWLTG